MKNNCLFEGADGFDLWVDIPRRNHFVDDFTVAFLADVDATGPYRVARVLGLIQKQKILLAWILFLAV